MSPVVTQGSIESARQCGSCGEPAPYMVRLQGQLTPACLRHYNHWRTPLATHGYGDESDCVCGRNFATVRGLREHLTKMRGAS